MISVEIFPWGEYVCKEVDWGGVLGERMGMRLCV